jgi:hypothetical protein
MNFRGKYRWMVSRKALRLLDQNPAATFTVPRAIAQWSYRRSKAASVGGLFHFPFSGKAVGVSLNFIACRPHGLRRRQRSVLSLSCAGWYQNYRTPPRHCLIHRAFQLGTAKLPQPTEAFYDGFCPALLARFFPAPSHGIRQRYSFAFPLALPLVPPSIAKESKTIWSKIAQGDLFC